MKVYTRQDKFWGLLRTDRPPRGIMAVCKGYFIFTCVAAVFMFFFLLANDWDFLASLVFAAVLVGTGLILLIIRKRAYQAWSQFYWEMQKKEKAEEEKEKAYRKEHEDELFYQECRKAGIYSNDAAGVARMKLVAKQMEISCGEEELVKKFLNGRDTVREQERLAAEKERQARIPALRKEEQALEKEFNKYINLQGNEKRIQDCKDLVARAREIVARYSNSAEVFEKGGQALYSTYAKKETDWAVHGGVASAIAGGAAGVAVAADIQRKNAEARAYNNDLSQTIGRFTAEQQLNATIALGRAEKDLEQCEKELEQAKLKLVEERPQYSLLTLLDPQIVKTSVSESGAITFTVSTKSAALTIYDTVKATVDGSFKVKIMDGDRLAGEAYFTLPYKGSYRSAELTGICASLPEEEKRYTFTFVPHNLFAMEL